MQRQVKVDQVTREGRVILEETVQEYLEADKEEEKIRNEELWERAGQEPVAKQILRRKAWRVVLDAGFLRNLHTKGKRERKKRKKKKQKKKKKKKKERQERGAARSYLRRRRLWMSTLTPVIGVCIIAFAAFASAGMAVVYY
nr:hypothetical protein BaRGS_014446 [Batillaria attramentaria]